MAGCIEEWESHSMGSIPESSSLRKYLPTLTEQFHLAALSTMEIINDPLPVYLTWTV